MMDYRLKERSEDILLLTGPICSGKSLTLKSSIHSLDTNPLYTDFFHNIILLLDL